VEGGTGLRGLQDRLAALDGRLEIRSVGGEGTVLRATIPAGAAPAPRPGASEPAPELEPSRRAS
jgi:signal transduction histidine kinase